VHDPSEAALRESAIDWRAAQARSTPMATPKHDFLLISCDSHFRGSAPMMRLKRIAALVATPALLRFLGGLVWCRPSPGGIRTLARRVSALLTRCRAVVAWTDGHGAHRGVRYATSVRLAPIGACLASIWQDNYGTFLYPGHVGSEPLPSGGHLRREWASGLNKLGVRRFRH